MVGRSQSCAKRWPGLCLAASLGLAVVSRPSPAVAQELPGRLQSDAGGLLRLLIESATQAGSKAGGQVFSVVNQIQLYDIEGEIDRLVGSPWQLSDSTTYKLELAPQHVAFPVYDQLVRQMTRLDDIRTSRIQNLTVDAVPLIAVDLDALRIPMVVVDDNIVVDEQTGHQLLNSILGYFNAREILDLGVFMLAQQPYFPQTQDEWDARKHDLATHKGALALTLAGLGALFQVGALSDSGTLTTWRERRYQMGWYAGFSRLGYRLAPNLRGGVTAFIPGLELSAGLMDQIRSGSNGFGTAFEFALRESWLNRYTAATGWDSFFEAALRTVLSAGDGYSGERLTGRGGLFLKREHPFHWRYITLRGSFEAESNLNDSLRFAAGLGVDYTKTGLSTVLQSSRTLIPGAGSAAPETRTGVFVAGTLESPAQYYVDIMDVRACLLGDAWLAYQGSEDRRATAEARLRVLAGANTMDLERTLQDLRRSTAESENWRAEVATRLADYLESRRLAYTTEHWTRGPGDVHGPVDGSVLVAACDAVAERVVDLANFLDGRISPLRAMRERFDMLGERAAQDAASSDEATASLDEEWRRESLAVTEGLRQYGVYLGALRRIAAVASPLVGVWSYEPLSPRKQRSLITLVAQPLQ